jgi:carbon-monoxide dehydrogenase small subunit
LGLTGTKEGCGVGECGACTVIIAGQTINACLVLAVEVNGKEITTIEGLADGDNLHPIQQAFLEVGGLQCGFCTPGMILSTKVLLDEVKEPTDEEMRKGLEGNFCRCTGYTKIFESVRAAAQKLK